MIFVFFAVNAPLRADLVGGNWKLLKGIWDDDRRLHEQGPSEYQRLGQPRHFTAITLKCARLIIFFFFIFPL